MTNVVHGTFRESPLRNTRGTDDDLALGDVANDVLCTVIELLQGDSDLAVRTMLLAVASLTSDARPSVTQRPCQTCSSRLREKRSTPSTARRHVPRDFPTRRGADQSRQTSKRKPMLDCNSRSHT
jgi:hypothetical protein